MDPVSQARATVAHDLRQGGILDRQLQGYEERLPQVQMAEAVAESLTNGKHLLSEASTGTGKALDVDTVIATVAGWKKMGDLACGDLIFDENGQPTKIISAFDVMYDRPCYEIVFSDGATLVADAEHEWASYTLSDRLHFNKEHVTQAAKKNFATETYLKSLHHMIETMDDRPLSLAEASRLIGGHHWSIYQASRPLLAQNSGKAPSRFASRALLHSVYQRLMADFEGQRRDGRKYTLLTTEQIAATLRSKTKNPRLNHAVKVAGALSLQEKDVPIDPYYLGVWLGDGSSRNNQITSSDPEIIPEIEKAGYTVRKLVSNPYLYAVDDEKGKARSRWQPGMTGRLRALNLIQNKHIPPLYLRASLQQRRDLLAGLLDTDGTVTRSGSVEFTTTSSALSQDVYELVASLGYRPSCREGRARFKGKDCGPKWTIAFTTPDSVFRLPRKMRLHKERLRNYNADRNSFRYIVDVRPVPSRPVRCIQVDAPSHLYLAGRAMIPTHNSLAYLLPVVRSGKTVLVATANKALQEQLFYKDIPFIQHYVQKVEAALIKGMGNYLCLKHLEEERAFQQIVGHPAFTELDELAGDAAFDGDLDVVPFALPKDIRGRVAAESDDCAWRECPHFGNCFVRAMRERAQTAQIVVINHTLLLLDVLMEGWLLPDRDAIIIDEAHHLEDEATRAFTATVSPRRVESLLSQRRLREHCDPGVLEAAVAANVFCWSRLDEITHLGTRNRTPLPAPLEEGLRLATALEDVKRQLQARKPEVMDKGEEALYTKLVTRTSNLIADLRLVLGMKDRDNRVYYVERVTNRRGREAALAASAAPLSVTEMLREKLFDRISVVATSATLAIDGSFAYYRGRVGVGDAQELVLPPAFDYERNAVLYVPYMKHEPSFGKESGPYHDELAREMGDLVRAARGRAFLLFTSMRTLREVWDRLADDLSNEDYFLLSQDSELTRAELLRRFKTGERAVLFGLRSFWEGIDVQGEALSLVAIDKLPFDPPDDPVHEARVNRMKAEGQNWFGDYVLPQAILRLKQGVGRLLRTRTDRGVLAILDSRLLTKSYGRQVVRSLPPARRTTKLDVVRAFFADDAD